MFKIAVFVLGGIRFEAVTVLLSTRNLRSNLLADRYIHEIQLLLSTRLTSSVGSQIVNGMRKTEYLGNPWSKLVLFRLYSSFNGILLSKQLSHYTPVWLSTKVDKKRKRASLEPEVRFTQNLSYPVVFPFQ